MILLDTNLLIRMTRPLDPQCSLARAAVQNLMRRGERLVIVPQNLYEFWAVTTRSAGPPPSGRNGLGMTPTQASQWLRFFQRRFTLLYDREELTNLWQALVESHSIIGFKAHDARLVAAMQSYGIRSCFHLMTLISAACPSQSSIQQPVRFDSACHFSDP